MVTRWRRTRRRPPPPTRRGRATVPEGSPVFAAGAPCRTPRLRRPGPRAGKDSGCGAPGGLVRRPAIIVTPERDTPGASARAWAKPMPKAPFQPRSVNSLRWGERVSTTQMTPPKAIISMAISQACPAIFDDLLEGHAQDPAGIVDSSSSQRALSGRFHATPDEAAEESRKMCLMSRQVEHDRHERPRCRATSKVLFSSGCARKSPSSAARDDDQVAELEIGTNSQIPARSPGRWPDDGHVGIPSVMMTGPDTASRRDVDETL